MRNVAEIKKDFPIFANHPDLVYLDSAATSQTPSPVIERMDAHYREARANAHRGGYQLAEIASAQYEDARKTVADFIGAAPEEVVFTFGATHAANLLIRSLEETILLEKGDSIVVSTMEHHSVFVTLQQLAKKYECDFRVIPIDTEGVLDMNEGALMIDSKTKIVAITSISNVSGTKNNTLAFAELAKKVGATFIVDAAQHTGHLPLSVRDTGADFLFFSGHKMLGPTGIGVLWGKKERLSELKPGYFGGGAVAQVTKEDTEFLASPGRFEPGSQNIAGAIGLAEACRYISKTGIDDIAKHSRLLADKAAHALANISGISLYHGEGIVSFARKGVHSHDVSEILSREGIAVRAGHHCAEPYVRALGHNGFVRASFYLYNDESDVEKLIAGVKKAVQLFSSSH